ncbi:uncharacterized protein LOC133303629 [Gastrolobium bilobum]|uniref:uncharacterized protein LOC133303629 n=1 Tax=Gastrolobium bilobum TaxID=150636 RepID=UPI002AAF4599|nr:uncharacterized protein LOC133303629 [Gastrolobium bilobum]
MASNNNGGGGGGKEERRRRIAERGSDRMALITGRINALPPTPPSTTSSPTHRQAHRHAQSLFDSYSDHNDNSHLQTRHLRPQSLSSSPFSDDYHEDHIGSDGDKHDASNFSTRLKHQGGFKYSNFDNLDNKGEEEALMQDSDTISEVSEGDGSKTKPSSVTSRGKNAALDTQQLKKLCRHTFFSSRELNSSIIASETIRALSSLVIALLVVFFYAISESIVASRPLYLVLLTDITIVLARLYREKARVLKETEGERVEAHGDGHSWGDAVKLLERGLVAYQAIRGVFIDCSIYLVVVVCGTSFM